MLSPGKKIPYGEKDPRQIRLKSKFCLAVATTSIPTSIKQSFEFFDYIGDLDHRHTIPGRKAATSGVRQLYFKGKERLKMQLFAALSLLILTADIWSKPGFSSSYLGITVHFISESFKLESAVLELVYFPSRHTGQAIADVIKKVLNDWGISHLVSTITTDNASNMIKAFKRVKSYSQVKILLSDYIYTYLNPNSFFFRIRAKMSVQKQSQLLRNVLEHPTRKISITYLNQKLKLKLKQPPKMIQELRSPETTAKILLLRSISLVK